MAGMISAIDMPAGGQAVDLYDIEAEQDVLGVCLIDNAMALQLLETARPEDFWHPSHVVLASAIADAVAAGQLADPLTLAKRFEGHEGFQQFGGAKVYLVGLTQAYASRQTAPAYAAIVADLATRRRLQDICRDATTRVSYDDWQETESDAGEICRDVASQIMDLSDRKRREERKPAEIAKAVLERATGQMPTAILPTGLAELDAHSGGIDIGNHVIVGGGTSMGKSAFAHCIAANVCRGGVPVWIYSREMSQEQVFSRMTAAISGIPVQRIYRGQIDHTDHKAFVEALAEVESWPLTVYPQDHFAFEDVLADLALAKVQGTVPDLIVVDYLQLMFARRLPRLVTNRNLELGYLTNGLKGAAATYGTRIMSLSQFSRDLQKRDDHRPTMADLRDSGEIEQSGNQIWLLHRDEYYLARKEPDPGTAAAAYADWQAEMERVRGLAEIIIAKERDAPVGKVRVAYDGPCTRFRSLHPHQQAA